jgi:hypothetical protein
MKVSVVLLVALASLCYAELSISYVRRVIDVTNPIAREETSFSITSDKSGVKSFLLAFENLSVAYKRLTAKDSDVEISLEKTVKCGERKCVQVELNEPLKANEKNVFILTTSYLVDNLITPYPKRVDIGQTPSMKLAVNAYLLSPYPVVKQKVFIK